MNHLVQHINVVLIGESSGGFAKVKQQLQRLGYDIAGIAENETAAMDIAAALNPKIAVINASLFGLDSSVSLGTRFFLQYGTPSLLITTGHDEEMLQAVIAANGMSYLAYPANGLSLHTALQTCLKCNTTEPLSNEKEQLYRTTFENSPIGMAIVRLNDFQLIKTNIAYRELLGYNEEELKELTIAEITHPDDLEKNLRLQKQLGSGRILSFTMDKRFVRKDKSIAHGHLVASIIHNEKGQPSYFLGQVVDISERVHSEQQKQEMELLLRQSHKMEALGTLAGGIAHDFNNILGAIMGYTELAMCGSESGESVKDDLSQILVGVDRAKKLVRQILTFSRRNELESRPLDLHLVINDSLALMERAIPKMIKIKRNFADGLPLVSGDPHQLEQIIKNLGNNAVDAMPDGGTLLFETDFVRTKNAVCNACGICFSGEFIRLKVKDSGHGMDVSAIDHIFEPFYTTKEVGRGSGLGLATAFGVVNRLGGHIRCTSSKGQGAVFEVFFPALPNNAEAESTQRLDRQGAKGVNETILLVDDEQALRDIGRRILLEKGYKVLSAKNGEEAIELFKANENKIDMIVLDISMPGMGGYRCLKELLSINRFLKILLASGYLDGEPLNKAIKSGAAGFITKPFKKAEMLSKVRGILDL